MRYKVGDKVVMRSDLDSGEYYGDLKYSGYIELHAGDVVEIVEEDRSDHTYKTEHWFWLNDRMINHRKTEALSGSRLRYKVGDKVVLREGIDSNKTYEGLYPTSAYLDNRGKSVTIRNINRSGATPFYDIEEVKGSGWITESLIDHPTTQCLVTADKQQKENNNMQFKVGDKVKYIQGLKEWEIYDYLTFSGYREDPVLTIGQVDGLDNTYRVEQGSWGRWVSAGIIEAVEELAVMPQWFDTWFKTFDASDFDKGKAIYHLSRAGWGHTLIDGNGNEFVFPNGRGWSSNYGVVGNGSEDRGLLLLVDAVINGYVVEEENAEREPLYYVQFVEGSRDSYLNKDIGDGTFNTMSGTQSGSFQTKFTEKEIKEINPAYWELRKPVKERYA